MKRLLSSPAALLRATLLAASMCAITVTAHAAPATPASVQKLVAVMRVDRVVETMMVKLDKTLQDGLRKPGQSAADSAITDKYIQRATVMIREEMNVADFRTAMTEIYARQFSEDEVLAITAFYQSPAGQAMLERMPQMMEESNKLAQSMLTRTLPKLQALIGEMRDEQRKQSETEKPQ